MKTHNYDVMFIDPADDGERSVLQLSRADRRIVAVLMLSGPSARPFYRRMNEEHISLDSVVEDFIGELRHQAEAQRLTIKEWVKVMGSADAVSAVAQLADELPGARILLPDPSEAIGPEGFARLADRCEAEIITPRRRRVA